MEIITSLENSKVKYWKKLQVKKYRDEEDFFLIEGEHLVEEAIKSNSVIELISIDEINNSKIPVHYVTKEVMNKLSELESPSKIMAVCNKLKEEKIGKKILLLDAIQDPGNLGTLIRSAVAFNIDTIILSNDTVDLYNEKVIRASQGMIFHINILKKDLMEIIQYLKQNNYKIYTTKVDGGTSIKNIKLQDKSAIILGNEGQGVKEELINQSDEFIYIPISNECESLNVSIAGSIIMYVLGEYHE